MNSRTFRALFGLVASVVLALLVCADVSAQTSWTKYAGNPVFTTTAWTCTTPVIVFDGTQYRMWYAAWSGGYDIRYATSPDGITWTDNGFAVPRGDVTPQWVDTPAVIVDDGVYKMWYGGGTTAGGYGIMCYATSSDGVTWTKYASNPVFTKSGSEMHSGSVIKDGSTYKLWYHAWFGGSDPYIGYATSPDGISWTDQGVVLDQGSSGAPDTNYVGDPSVLKRNGQYEMWYGGVNASNVQTIQYATSSDGVTWTKYASNPILNAGGPGSWDAAHVMCPTVLLANGALRMWYVGLPSGASYAYAFGYATSSTSVVAGTTLKAPGDSVTLPISISDVTGLGLDSADLVVGFDTAKLTFDGISTTGTLTAGWTTDYNENLGLIDIGLASSTNATGAGTLVNLLFTVKPTASGTAAITLDSVLLNENEIPVTKTNGAINIASLKYGDVSADNLVGTDDATQILQHAVGKITAFTVESVQPAWWTALLTPTQALEVADVSDNGSATAHDAALVLKRTLNIITSFPAESAGAPSALLAGGFSYRLEGSAETVRPGDTVTLKLHLDGNGSVYSGDLAFEYDPAAFRVVDVTSPSADLAHGLVAKNTESGRLSLAIASATPLRGDDFVEVTLVASPSFRKGALGDVRLSRFDVNESRLQPTAFSFGLMAYQFRVLPNYPNPFNPETWIPFELDATSRVTVNVYGAKGELVRRMDLGVRDAGEYVDKAKSAYWDGRNEQGEVVASGLYYYEIRTESASAIRAMVIRK